MQASLNKITKRKSLKSFALRLPFTMVWGNKTRTPKTIKIKIVVRDTNEQCNERYLYDGFIALFLEVAGTRQMSNFLDDVKLISIVKDVI